PLRSPGVAFAYPGWGRRPIPLLVIDDAGYRAVAGVAGDIVVLVRVEKGVGGEQPRAVSDHAREPEPDPRAETQGAEAGAIVVGDRRADHRDVDGSRDAARGDNSASAVVGRHAVHHGRPDRGPVGRGSEQDAVSAVV